MNKSAKPYPWCGISHVCIDTPRALKAKHDIKNIIQRPMSIEDCTA
jgi:hypothetical protein